MILKLIKYGNAYASEYVPFDISEQEVARLEEAANLTKEEILPMLDCFATNPCAKSELKPITVF